MTVKKPDFFQNDFLKNLLGKKPIYFHSLLSLWEKIGHFFHMLLLVVKDWHEKVGYRVHKAKYSQKLFLNKAGFPAGCQ